MPMHKDFQKILNQFVARYGKEKGSNLFYAWINRRGLDDSKPYSPDQLRLNRECLTSLVAGLQESFQWSMPLAKLLKQDKEAKYYQVEAHFAVTSMNGNVYTLEELLQAIHTLPGKHVDLNHNLSWKIGSVEITAAMVENGCAECIIRVPNGALDAKGRDVQECFDTGIYHAVSIEADCLSSEVTGEGNVAVGLTYTGLAVLDEEALPGIPLTTISPLEKLMESIFKETEKGIEDNQKQKKVLEVKKVVSETQEKERKVPANETTKIVELATDLAEKIKENAVLTEEIARLTKKLYMAESDLESRTGQYKETLERLNKQTEQNSKLQRDLAESRTHEAEAIRREGETSEKLAAETQKRVDQENELIQLREEIKKKDQALEEGKKTLDAALKEQKRVYKILNKEGIFQVDPKTGNLIT